MHTALFVHSSHRLFPDVLRLAERCGPVSVMDQDGDWAGESDAADTRADMVLNFVTRCVFKGYVLSRPNANFHPASPAYPGIGGASRALYDGAETFGATAHSMARRIDAGPIYDVESIPVFDVDTSETLFARAEAACVTLVDRLTAHVATHGEMPPFSNRHQWTGRYMSVREFHHEWLKINATIPGDMERKLRAATHSKHSGPYFLIEGRRFVLAKDHLPS